MKDSKYECYKESTSGVHPHIPEYVLNRKPLIIYDSLSTQQTLVHFHCFVDQILIIPLKNYYGSFFIFLCKIPVLVTHVEESMRFLKEFSSHFVGDFVIYKLSHHLGVKGSLLKACVSSFFAWYGLL